MGIQMTAVVIKDNVAIPAPYEAFAENENVANYNQLFIDMYNDKEFCEMYSQTGSHTLVPEMDVTSRRRHLLNSVIGISFKESVQFFTNEQVQEMMIKLEPYKKSGLAFIEGVFNMDSLDFFSTLEFIETAACKGYDIAFG